jgi:N-formylglutamate amidohydrolase
LTTSFSAHKDVTIPGVLSIVAPKTEPIPLVFDSPHSGVTIPEDFKPTVTPDLVLTSTDTHVDVLFDYVPELGCPLLAALFPRSFVDVNRSRLDMDVALVDGEWPEPIRDNAAAKRGMGLIWRYAWGDTPMYTNPLSVTEVQARLDRYFEPYHAALRALLDETHKRFGRVYHINCHSMPAVGHALSPDPAGTVRADFVLGDRNGTSCEQAFVHLAAEVLRGCGYSVSLNVPFTGAELVQAYSNPADGRHSLQIEINRRLYMNESSRERLSSFDNVKADLTHLSQRLRDYVVTR